MTGNGETDRIYLVTGGSVLNTATASLEHKASTMILSIGRDGSIDWRFGPNLPVALSGGTVVPYRHSFMILGGQNATGNVRDILEYDSVNEEWIRREEQLFMARQGGMAIRVPDTYCRMI